MNVGQILETHLGWAMMVLGSAGGHAGVRRRDRRRDPQGASTRPTRPSAIAARTRKASARPSRQSRARRGNAVGRQGPAPRRPHRRAVRAEDDGRLHLHDEAAPPGRRQDPRPRHRPVLADHAAAARRQGPHRRPALRRDGSVGPRSVRRGLRPAGTPDGQVATTSKAAPRSTRSMVKGTNTLEAGTPVSFDVLCNEIRGLGPEHPAREEEGLRSSEEDEDLM